MGVVWSCYKYLKLLQVAHLVEHYIEADNEVWFFLSCFKLLVHLVLLIKKVDSYLYPYLACLQ